jgi:hypothetical protein
MTAVRSVLLMAVLAVCASAFPAAAGAQPLSPYEGGGFPNIEGPEGSEEFAWEVNLGEEQELRSIDDRHIGVFYSTGHESFSITATEAHDAEGATVPTTIAITGESAVTLTVHHRAGNPAAGGAPFHYPVIAGAGWEGGFQTIHVSMPPTEQAPAPPQCTVPDLGGRTLRAARKMLNRSHCELGPVRGERSRGARVVRQYRAAGKSLPAGTEVGVKVLRP